MQDGMGKIEERQFDEAYQLFERASDLYLKQERFRDYVKARLEMAKATQFTSKVSRGAIRDILARSGQLISEGLVPYFDETTTSYYVVMGQYYRTVVGDYQGALQMFDTALIICDSLGDPARQQKIEVLVENSQILANQEKFNEAVEAATGALNLSRDLFGEASPLLGPRYYNLGFINYRKGHYDAAEEIIKKGIEVLQQGDGPEMQIALGYNNLSAVYVAQMNLSDAIENAAKFERIALKYLGPGHEAMGMIQWDLGQLNLNRGKFNDAVLSLTRAIEIFTNRFGSEYQQLPDLYHQLAAAHAGMDSCDVALDLHKKALELKKSLFVDEAAKLAESYRYLGQHHLDCGDYAQAQAWVDQALEIAQASLDPGALSLSWLHDLRGDIYYRQDSFEKSAIALSEALNILAQSDESRSLSDNPPIDSLYNLLYAVESSTAKSQALLALYHQNNQLEILAEASKSAEFTDRILDELRSNYSDPESKNFLQTRARDHYQAMLEIAYSQWRVEGNSEKLEVVWKAMEKARSLLLMESLKEQNFSGLGLPDSVYQVQRSLKADLQFQESQILQARELGLTDRLPGLRDTLHMIRSDLQKHNQFIESKYPTYHDLTSKISPISIVELQSTLEDGECFIEFFLADNHIYKSVITNASVEMIQQEKRNLEDLIIKWKTEIEDLEMISSDPETALAKFDELSHQLYLQLWGDLQDLVSSEDQLIIVPDQELSYLSFEALCVDQDSPQFANKYLLAAHPIQYAYSGSHFAQTRTQSSSTNSLSFAGFAPSYFTDHIEFDSTDALVSRLYRAGTFELPGAKHEVTSINELMGGRIWIDEQATETAFKENVSAFDLIHLSLHGLINDEEPLYSKLVFAGIDSINDGMLNAYEIYELPLDARLVVLSACNTGLGKLVTGEGLMSLSRSFSFAGCPNLIASLWKADDQTTADIMVRFYKNLGLQKSISKAIRDAKLDYLGQQRSDLLKHPYFWSAFTYYGQASPESKHTPSIVLWIAGLLLVGTLLYLAVNRLS
jgi:CHAT domain-containing protein